ncbi:MAG: NfeD family protein [Candidatus Muiribacteriota bacterium]|jgi:membrane protein implicated in regulation of membrane protease activity
MADLAGWVYWVTGGVILCILEMFTAGFFFMNIGLSAVITGAFAYFGFNIYFQFVIFSILNIILFVFVKNFYEKLFGKNPDVKTNVDAITGSSGIVLSRVKTGEHGEVKVKGEIWYALPLISEKVFEKDSKVIVKKVEGSKILVDSEE